MFFKKYIKKYFESFDESLDISDLYDYFISKEFLGNFLIQFHKKNYVNNFYSKRSTELYFLGCIIAFLYTIPLINFFIPFISNVLFSNIILENKIKIKN